MILFVFKSAEGKIIYYQLSEDIQKIIKDLCKWKAKS